MKHILSFFCLTLSLVFSLQAYAQQTDSLSRKPIHQIGFDIRPGYVFPTASFFSGDNAEGKVVDCMLSAHLRYAFRFGSDSYWGKLYPNAYQGIGVVWHTFFAHRQLGTPVSVYVFQGSPIVRLSPRLTLDYEWNFGASFGWKKGGLEDDAPNDVIGSVMNAYMNLGFLLNWQIDSHWRLTAGVDFTHFSDGNTGHPNAGVNAMGARVGLVRTVGGGEVNDGRSFASSSFLHERPFSYDVVVYGATRKRGIMKDEYNAFLAPGSFGVVGLNFTPMYKVNKYFRAGVSLDAQYDESANLRDYHLENSGTSEDAKFYRPPFREQFAVGLSLRGELVMPVFSVNFGVGRNILCKGDDTDCFYQVLALKTFVTRRAFLHIGYQLSRFKDPNNLMLGLGYRF